MIPYTAYCGNRCSQAESERLSERLVSERAAAAAALRLTRITHGALAVLLLLLALGAGAIAWRAAGHARVQAGQSLAAAQGEIARLKRQLGVLELYRVSLELDTGAWIHNAAGDAGPSAAGGHTGWEGPAVGQPYSEGSCRADSSHSGNATFDPDTAHLMHACSEVSIDADSSNSSSSYHGSSSNTSCRGGTTGDAIPGSRHINDSATFRLLGGPSGGGALLTSVLQRSQQLATLQSRARRQKQQQGQEAQGQEGGGASEQQGESSTGQPTTGHHDQPIDSASKSHASSSKSHSELDLRTAWLSGWGFNDAPLDDTDPPGIETPDEPPHPWTFVSVASMFCCIPISNGG